MDDLTETDKLLNDSRTSQSGNGSPESLMDDPPTSGSKWLAALLLGVIFFILSSGVFYNMTSMAIVQLGGKRTMYGSGPTLGGLLLHTILFIIIVRVILW